MKYILNLSDIKYISAVKSAAVAEILLQTASFSKVGSITDEEIARCISAVAKANKDVVLAWDTLCKDGVIHSLGNMLSRFSDRIDAIRFMDPGVGLYLKENFPELKLQFSMEYGPPNQVGILDWIDVFSPNLSRVVVSNQMPVSIIQLLRGKTSLELELLGAGRIEMFYSARTLLGRYLPRGESPVIEATAASEDRPRQLSPVLENPKGTLMFYYKDLFVLDAVDDCTDSGIDWLRLEFYEDYQYEILQRNLAEKDWIMVLKENWRVKTTQGFFRVNKSHRLLEKLTNKFLKDEKENQVGIVLESIKNSYTLIETRQELHLPLDVLFLSPERKKTVFRIKTLIDLRGSQFSRSVPVGYYLLPWVKHTVPATIIRLRD